MAELPTIARPYAEALFEAVRANLPQAAPLQSALDAVAALIADGGVAALLSNPQISDERRFALLTGLLDQAPPPQVAELLKLIIENGRLSALPEVAEQFRDLVNQSQGVAQCIIESAFPVSSGDLTGLVAALRRKFPFDLKPEVRVNPQLIGGVRVTVGDRVLDNSVR
ncbi:MAG TPA: F0F1 ATP synthase subunit delta, partial [Burkholderiaceae bacterium]|nr:F0F1 ATP synthase subunit delta [Burkholderiaceae bacterium]